MRKGITDILYEMSCFQEHSPEKNSVPEGNWLSLGQVTWRKEAGTFPQSGD